MEELETSSINLVWSIIQKFSLQLRCVENSLYSLYIMHKVKEDEMGKACSMNGAEEECI
jgi:hypothetical protein